MLKSSVPVVVLFSQVVLFRVMFNDCWNGLPASLELHSTVLLYSLMFLAILLTGEVKPLDDMWIFFMQKACDLQKEME